MSYVFTESVGELRVDTVTDGSIDVGRWRIISPGDLISNLWRLKRQYFVNTSYLRFSNYEIKARVPLESCLLYRNSWPLDNTRLLIW